MANLMESSTLKSVASAVVSRKDPREGDLDASPRNPPTRTGGRVYRLVSSACQAEVPSPPRFPRWRLQAREEKEQANCGNPRRYSMDGLSDFRKGGRL
jgi:hypothetical protein